MDPDLPDPTHPELLRLVEHALITRETPVESRLSLFYEIEVILNRESKHLTAEKHFAAHNQTTTD